MDFHVHFGLSPCVYCGQGLVPILKHLRVIDPPSWPGMYDGKLTERTCRFLAIL
jgi:hypothetical protein